MNHKQAFEIELMTLMGTLFSILLVLPFVCLIGWSEERLALTLAVLSIHAHLKRHIIRDYEL